MRWLLLALVPGIAFAQTDRKILVVTASSGDYILGAGGTLAGFIREGWRVDVAQFGNDDKMSLGLTPAQTRLANITEGKAAAKLLGVTDVVNMDHKSGEIGYVSTTEMRNQLFALIRGMKPKIIFIPDPYVHYQDDSDLIRVGRMAEEAWGYSGGSTFGNELTRMGLKPYGAPEIFYYATERPYRRNEGGYVAKAKFVARDVTATIEQKISVAQLLLTRNRAWLGIRFGPVKEDRINGAVRDWITELGAFVGGKHGFAYGEEFNHVGPPR